MAIGLYLASQPGRLWAHIWHEPGVHNFFNVLLFYADNREGSLHCRHTHFHIQMCTHSEHTPSPRAFPACSRRKKNCHLIIPYCDLSIALRMTWMHTQVHTHTPHSPQTQKQSSQTNKSYYSKSNGMGWWPNMGTLANLWGTHCRESLKRDKDSPLCPFIHSWLQSVTPQRTSPYCWHLLHKNGNKATSTWLPLFQQPLSGSLQTKKLLGVKKEPYLPGEN